LVSRTLLAWIGGKGKQFRAALDYLEYLPKRLERTPIGNPSPTGVAGYLDLHFKAEVVDVLALRLLKEPDWPFWKQYGVLLYLREHPNASLTEPLIRFVSLATDEEIADLTVEAIRATNDKDLQAKLRAEEAWLRSQKKAMPARLSPLVK
jgi:hypothetical protein